MVANMVMSSTLSELLEEDCEYIPSDEKGWFSAYKTMGIIKRKVPIAEVKIDKNRFSYCNPIYNDTVETILEYFDTYQWNPIFLDEENYLRDGQHRLKVAELLNLKVLD